MNEAIAGQVVRVFSEFLGQATKHRGMPRKKIVKLIHDYCFNAGLKDQAMFWKHANSDPRLKHWLIRQDEITEGELVEFLNQTQKIPGIARKYLEERAKQLTPLSGGKPRALSLGETVEAQCRYKELRAQGTSTRKAWEQIASEMEKRGREVSEHTIRRACDPKEAERSRYATRQKKAAVIYSEPRK